MYAASVLDHVFGKCKSFLCVGEDRLLGLRSGMALRLVSPCRNRIKSSPRSTRLPQRASWHDSAHCLLDIVI